MAHVTDKPTMKRIVQRPILAWVPAGFFKQSLTLNLNECGQRLPKKFGTLDLGLNLGTNRPNVDLIDASIPLDRQGWYHGSISRIDAEKILRPLSEGSFLVRNSESTRQDYSLTLKSAKGFMHMRIQRDADSGQFILGQFSRPFPTIPDMIRHFCLNRLPVRGAEHMCLLEPVIAQIL
uniref:SH2 domain-containing adapter protein D n=1 Tax=Anopheles melas TaxID=34690 RepID=A0A182UJM2_9DIPT